MVNRFQCESPTRRALAVGLAAGLPLVGLMATHRGFRRGDGVARVMDLVNDDGLATPLARGFFGQRISVAGFRGQLADSAGGLDLYDRAIAPCLTCGLLHDTGPALAVIGAVSSDAGRFGGRLSLTGVLEPDASGAPRLVV